MGRGTTGQERWAASCASAVGAISEPIINPAPALAALSMNPRRFKPLRASHAHNGRLSLFIRVLLNASGRPRASRSRGGERTLVQFFDRKLPENDRNTQGK